MHPKRKRNYKKDRVYSADFKENAIQLALRSSSIEVAAKELSIPKQTLYTWVINFKKGQLPKSKSELDQPNMESLQSNVVSLMEENRRLNKTVAVLLEEKAILKNCPKAPLSKARHRTKQPNALSFDVRDYLYRIIGIDLTQIHGIGQQ